MRNENKESMMSFRLPTEYKKRVERIAKSEFYTSSQWLWKIVKTEIDRIDAETEPKKLRNSTKKEQK